jgi:hypothetical protein
MKPSRSRAHFAEALRWSQEAPLGWWQAVAAGLGMAVPVAVGLAIGQPGAGFAAAVGGLMVGALPPEKDALEQLKDLGLALGPAAAAILATVLIGRPGPHEEVLVVLLAALASLVGGFSRTMVIAAYRFVLFVLITVAVAGEVPDRAVLLVPFALGLAWTGAANLVLGALARALRRKPRPEPEMPPAIPFAKRYAHWRRGLSHLAGWQYTLRLTACLALAFALARVWPEHRLHWIAVTVVLLTERTLDPLPVKTTQRAIGTLVGVVIAAVLGGWGSPFALVASILVLATARAALRLKNYLLYTIVTTPLILAVLDAGAPPDRGLLEDRLLATLAAAALVLTANAVMRRWLPRS